MLSEERRNVMVVGDTDQSIYRFRGADYRNLMRFEEVFPEATVIVLDAELPVDATHPRRRQRRHRQQRGPAPETPLDRADRRRADHAVPGRGRARRGRLRRSRDHAAHRHRGSALRRRRRLLPDERAEPRHRRGARARRHPVPRRRRHEVLRPARGEGRVRLSARARESRRRGRAGSESSTRPSAAWATRRSRRSTRTRRVPASRSVTRCATAAAAGVTGKALGGIRDLLQLMIVFERYAPDGVARTVEAILDQTGYVAELEAERTIEAQGRIENLKELVGVCHEFDEALDSGDTCRARRHRGVGAATDRVSGRRVPVGLARIQAFLEAISLVTDLDAARARTSRGHVDDAAHREGARVPRRVPHRARGRRSSRTYAPRRPGGARGGAPPVLRRDHPARERLYLCHAWSRHAVRRRPTTTRRAGSSRRSPTSSSTPWARNGRAAAAVSARIATRWCRLRSATRRPSAAAPIGSARRGAIGLRIGDDVEHDKFGEGVILDLIGDGDKAEAVVNFRGVGEKRLLLAWAPLRKV